MPTVPNESRPMRAVADRGACCAYGICHEICPEVWVLDDAGMIAVDNAPIPAELLEKAIEGAEACPANAIAVEPMEA